MIPRSGGRSLAKTLPELRNGSAFLALDCRSFDRNVCDAVALEPAFRVVELEDDEGLDFDDGRVLREDTVIGRGCPTSASTLRRFASWSASNAIFACTC